MATETKKSKFVGMKKVDAEKAAAREIVQNFDIPTLDVATEVETPISEVTQDQDIPPVKSNVQTNVTSETKESEEVKAKEVQQGREEERHIKTAGRPTKLESLIKESVNINERFYYLSTPLNKQASDRLNFMTEGLTVIDKDATLKSVVHMALNHLFDSFKGDFIKLKKKLDDERNLSL